MDVCLFGTYYFVCMDIIYFIIFLLFLDVEHGDKNLFPNKSNFIIVYIIKHVGILKRTKQNWIILKINASIGLKKNFKVLTGANKKFRIRRPL